MLADKHLKTLVLLALFLVAFHYYNDIILPLIFALIVSLGLLKPSQWLEKKGLPRVLSILIIICIPVAIFAGISWFYYEQFNDFAETLPDLSEKSEKAATEISDAVDKAVDFNIAKELENFRSSAGNILESGKSIIGQTFSKVTGLFSFLALIPIYIFFILYSRQYLRRFILKQFSGKQQEQILHFFTEAKNSMVEYFKGLGLVILIIGALNSLGLYLIGIDYALLLGTFAAFLIVLPYVGVIIGSILPVLVAFVTTDSLVYPLLVIGLFALVQFLEGNIITPKLMSETVDINPLAIIVFLVFMGFSGGILGMIIAVPLLALIKLVLEHIKEYRPWAILLGTKSDADA